MINFEHLHRQAFSAIEKAKNILIVTHYNPDGDGLSSSCAMAEYLSVNTKPYTLFCYSEPAKVYSFLPHLDEFVYMEDLEKNTKEEFPITFDIFDVIVVFDCGSLSRTKLDVALLGRGKNQIVIEMDHHPKIDSYADIEIRDSDAAATAEVVYNFFKTNNLKISKNIANILATGLITDTANFLYPSTSTNTIAVAADLVSRGAQLPKLTSHTMRNKSVEAMRLWGRIMANLRINTKYNLAITILSKDEFKNNNIDREELEGVSGFLSNLYGVNGLLFLREEGDGILRGSLRTSHPRVDISSLAKLLGGGGHPRASGFSLKGELAKSGQNWIVI